MSEANMSTEDKASQKILEMYARLAPMAEEKATEAVRGADIEGSKGWAKLAAAFWWASETGEDPA